MGPLVVLDVNVLRDQRVVDACLARFERQGEPVAIAEIALFELTQHADRWDPTVVGSLRLLARRPEAVIMTRNSKALGLAEEATGVPTASVVAPEVTQAMRAVLRDLAAGGGDNLQAFRRAVARYRSTQDHERHANDSLETARRLKMTAQPNLPRELVARIGNDLARKDRRRFRDFLQRELRIAEQRDAHVRRGVTAAAADALLSAPSVSYLFVLALGAIALEWVFKGGVETAKPGRIANDVLDIEHVIAGLWGGCLVSDDAGARDRFADLKAIGAAAWPTHGAWFDRAQAVAPVEALSSFLA